MPQFRKDREEGNRWGTKRERRFVLHLNSEGSYLTPSPARPSTHSDTVTLSQKPSPNTIASFKDHVRKTGQPETYRLTTVSQAFDLDDAEILAEFQIDRMRRDDLQGAPCPICSPSSPKYLAGYLVWFPKEHVIRAIGRECGKRISDRWAREQYAFKKRQQQQACERFLEGNLHLVPMLLSEYSIELKRAEAQEAVWMAMRRENPAITQTLRSAMQSGQLTAAEKICSISGTSLRTSSGTSTFREVRIGFCVGQSFVASRYEHAKKLETQSGLLRLFDFGKEPDDCILPICAMTTSEMEKAERAIKKSRKLLISTREKLDDFEKFFSPGNISIINRWAEHPSAPLQFKLTLSNNGKRLKAQSQEFGYTEISVADTSVTQQPP